MHHKCVIEIFYYFHTHITRVNLVRYASQNRAATLLTYFTGYQQTGGIYPMRIFQRLHTRVILGEDYVVLIVDINFYGFPCHIGV